MTKCLGFTAAVLMLGVTALAADKQTSVEQQVAMAAAVEPSLVIVEYTLRYDKGEAPHADTGDGGEAPADLIKQERPLERAGVLVDDTHVLTADAQIHPRFIKSITVHHFSPGGKADAPVNAAIAAYPKQQDALLLKLDQPLAGATAAHFDAKKSGPYSVVSLTQKDGRWAEQVGSFGGDLTIAGARREWDAPAGVVVDKDGAAVGISTGDHMPADDSWKGDPLAWPAVSTEEMTAALATLDAAASKNIVHVTLNFRSPNNLEQQQPQYGQDKEADAPVQKVLGVLMDDQSLLVLAETKPKVTARLERIKVFTDPPQEAKFKATLKDYGAFVATLDKPIDGVLPLSKESIETLRGVVLPAATVVLQGENRVAYVQPRRISTFNVGWRRNLYPTINGDEKSIFLFDPAGALLALPISQRQKASITTEQWNAQDVPLTAVSQIAPLLADLGPNSDPNNVPLNEAQENKLAWIGVELQAMTQELARANGVSDQTNDGDTGALITYVYPDSPAAKAGVEAGWVLLRIDADGQPKPIDVKIENDPFADRPFPWDRLGDAPESVFDRIPTPWSKVENTLVRNITDLGFGKTYTAELFHDGKIDRKTFTVVEGPTHYQSAAKFKNEALGLTVKDMTYEVRRYLQKKLDDPGVVISKIEMGSKASVSGLKPYELITHVNDQPVMNVADFQRLTARQTELRLSVKRMTAGRIVKVTLTDASTPATQPAASAAP